MSLSVARRRPMPRRALASMARRPRYNLVSIGAKQSPRPSSAMAKVTLPRLFADLTGPVRELEVEGCTLAEVVAGLERRYPGIAARIHRGQKLSPNVAVVVDGRIAVDGLATPLGPQSQVAILPAFGGG